MTMERCYLLLFREYAREPILIVAWIDINCINRSLCKINGVCFASRSHRNKIAVKLEAGAPVCLYPVHTCNSKTIYLLSGIRV